MTDNKCISPWIHLHTWPNNDVYPCCLTAMEDSVGNLNENTLAEIWNGKDMKKLRTQFLNNEQPASCKRCFINEANGGTSLRTHMNETFSHHMDLLQTTNADGSLDDLSIHYWDFRFSNICNMRCRSCGPQLSTGWYEDQKKMWGQLPNDLPDPGKNINMWNQIEPLFDKVEDIYFAGGEPLLMEEHYRILNKLDEMQKYDTIIRYNTNLSQLRYKKLDVLDIWPKFDNVHVGASIDGYGARAEYIRKGTDWNKIVANRKAIIQKAPDINFFVNFTISVQNAFHMTDFYEWALEDNFIRHPRDFHTNIVHHPEHLSLQILPASMKKELTKKYTDMAEKCKKWGEERVERGFLSVAKFMNDADTSHLIPEFKKNIEMVDIIRNENFAETFPELQDLVK